MGGWLTGYTGVRAIRRPAIAVLEIEMAGVNGELVTPYDLPWG